jgi:hypothetical protein
MALYCQISEVTRPHPAAVVVEFAVYDDATTPATVVIARASVGFQFVLYDATGAAVAETAAQRRARLRGEFDAYCARLLANVATADAEFAALRSAAIGYRYPAGT